MAAEALELGRELGDQHRVAALHTNLADLLHADGQHDAAMTHLKEAARRFASVDVGDAPRPEIWTLEPLARVQGRHQDRARDVLDGEAAN